MIVSQRKDEFFACGNYYHPAPKSRTKLYWLAGLVVLAGITLWLLFQNKSNRSEIAYLQADASYKEQMQLQEEQRENARKEALAAKNKNYRQNWDRFIKVASGTAYIKYTLGGISEFPVRVSNTSEYTLDQVDVKVDYIRKSGKVWQSKIISYLNVAPHTIETKVAPESVNGVNFTVTIQKIICKDMQFCYPFAMGTAGDPYYCP